MTIILNRNRPTQYPYIALGYAGFAYMVFSNPVDAWDYAEEHGGIISCFGGFENAVRLNDTLGM